MSTYKVFVVKFIVLLTFSIILFGIQKSLMVDEGYYSFIHARVYFSCLPD